MTVVVAVPDSAEGTLALQAAVAEAKLFDTDVVAVNFGRGHLDISAYEGVTVLTLSPTSDQVDGVLAVISEYNASRLVIGLKRRTPVGKALLGSISQQLLLQSPIPVLSVKVDEDEEG